uniref:Wadjet anti-phage system protein JetD domain-containing protein n=1 Tax=Acetatifactor sp. TaxID=1872090 RepID=UPI004056DA49
MRRYDEKILNLLLDKYEGSLLYSGRNQNNITIAIPIQKNLLPEYFDEASMQYDVIHEQLEMLEDKGYIRLVWKNKKRGHILEKCELVTEQKDEIYKYLGRKTRAGKEREIKSICEEYKGKTDILDGFLRWVEERLGNDESVRKYVNLEKPKDFSRLCEMVWRILTNSEECFLREFSVQYFHDSKLAEKEIAKAVGVIVRFSPDNTLKDLDSSAVLEEYNIYKNPSWLMLKGKTCLRIGGSLIDLCSIPGGIGIANNDIGNICWSRETEPRRVITIENLTSFHRWQRLEKTDCSELCIYLGGYHNHAKRRFLQKLYEAYPKAEYCHFGDMDCGGFRIWKDLCEKTGIPFKTLHMDCDTYIKYLAWGKELTETDRKLLGMMQEDVFYSQQKDLFAMMLNEGKKLEQESVRA